MAFPQISSPEGLNQLRAFAGAIETSIATSSSIFQPNLVRKISVLERPNCAVVSVETRRVKTVAVSYDDLDAFVPSVDDIVTNDIPGFPFDTVHDFISEINRPVDKVSMATLRFRYSIADLKVDPAKSKSKKDPQEVIDAINCKLTRLAGWRDILASVAEGPDFFSEELDWSERVKLKYRSMKALMAQSEPAKLLDTQYDKKATFVRLIDQWSDRLKRNFKFIYQSQREPIDFEAVVLQADWRLELVNTTRVLAAVPFLSLGGPAFTPGAPAPIFSADRQAVWPANYQAEIALHEMLSWQRSVDRVKMRVGLPAPAVTQLSFARNWVTEGVLVDTWRSLLDWLQGDRADAISIPRAELGALSLLATEDAAQGSRHLPEFKQTLAVVNEYVRKCSAAEAKGVKEMFRDWIAESKQFVDWFTTLVRDLDLVERVETMQTDRTKPWSALIEELLDAELAGEEGIVNENVADPDTTLATWRRYK